MNASLLAALSSPGAKPISRSPMRAEADKGKENAAGMIASTASSAKRAERSTPRPRAPSFTVPEPPSTPGRMENLRVLIEEGKKAAAEGRLAAAVRKYETAMVTLPEAYKPRLRKKIARLEARLDDEEDRAPGTPARSTPKACREAAKNADRDPGLLDLLHIAVQDVTAVAAAASAASTGGGPCSGRTAVSGAPLSSCSPRRSSPLTRGLAGARDMPPVPGMRGGSTLPLDKDGGDHDIDAEIDGLGGRLAASSLGAGPFDGASSYQSPPMPSRTAREYGGGDQRLPAEEEEEEATVEEGAREDDGYCGLGQAGDDGGWDEEEDVGMEGMDTQERLRAVNKGLSDKLEKQVVAIMNKASSEELTELHGIGPRRAQLILQTRATDPFETLADLTRIGMYPKQIVKMGRHNMLECLDVCAPAKEGSTGSP